MKKIRSLICFLMMAILIFPCACGGKDSVENSDGFSASEVVQTQALSIKNAYSGRETDVLNENLREYLSLTDESKIAMFLRSRIGQDYSISKTIKIEWQGGQAPYTVQLASDADFTKIVHSKLCFAKNYHLTANLFLPGNTYYYKIIDSLDNETAIDSFTVQNAPRIITVSGVKNVRDIGGYQTEEGKRIAYGKLFRGAHLDDITAGGKEVLLSLGVKSELDLRTSTEANDAVSSPIPDLSYTRISITLFDKIFDRNQKELIRKTMEFFSQESNYPIYYHCRAGADRTGTITFLLNGLCGVSFEDLTKDFELTSFFGTGSRWRSKVEVQAGKAYFTEDGVMNPEDSNYIAWGKLYQDMMALYGTESGKLSDAIAGYLCDIGVTETQIQNIRTILLDK